MNAIKTGLVVIAVGLGACASNPPIPADKLSRSQASVRSAQELNAQAEPQAAVHLRLAQEQIVEAKKLLGRGENQRASLMLERAEADADAARELARRHAARIEADTAKRNIEDMKQSMRGPKS
jgi:hypothetical protein